MRLPRTPVPALALTASAGAVTLAATFLRGEPSAWSNLLVAGLYLASLGLGGVFLAAMLEVSGARWSEPIAAVPRALAALLYPAAPLLLLVFVAAPELYAWDEFAVAGGIRAEWLSRPAWVMRSAIYLAAWFACARWLEVRPGTRPGRAAGCLVICGITLWLAAYDWLVLLTPHWGSTVYAVYVFGGLLAGAMAAVSLAVAAGGLGTPADGPRESTLHDLGKLLFGFSTFWMYLWFCQFMLIWYTNLPEETRYFESRMTSGWSVPFWTVVLLAWAVPFVLLLSRTGKRNPRVMALASAAVLFGHWLDLDLMVSPVAVPLRGLPRLVDMAVFAGTAGFAVLVVARRLRLSVGRGRGLHGRAPARASAPDD